MDGEISQEDTWAVIKAFFKDNAFVKHQIASFEEFMNSIQKTVEQCLELKIQPEYRLPDSTEAFYIKFGQTYLDDLCPIDCNERLSPRVARPKNVTYSAKLLVDITQKLRRRGRDGVEVCETKELQKILIGKVLWFEDFKLIVGTFKLFFLV